MRNLDWFFAVIAAALLFAAPGSADTLELKSGKVIEGKYLGGTQHVLSFEVNGRVQAFDTNDIVALTFTGRSSGSAPIAPAAAEAPADAAASVPPPSQAPAPTSNDLCRAAIQHLSLPPTAESPQFHPGLPLSPIELLYSSQGIDFYSVIFRFPNYLHVGGNSSLDISLIFVYQEEAARQQMIDTLRHTAIVLRQSDATPPSLDNFKFGVMHCAHDGKEMLLTGRCVVNDVQYFKPQACIVVPQAKGFNDLSMLAASGARNYRDAINGLNWLTGIDDVSNVGGEPLHFDLPKDALVKLKEFAARVGVLQTRKTTD